MSFAVTLPVRTLSYHLPQPLLCYHAAAEISALVVPNTSVLPSPPIFIAAVYRAKENHSLLPIQIILKAKIYLWNFDFQIPMKINTRVTTVQVM